MSLDNINKVLELVDREDLDDAEGIAWLLRELSGAVADTIDKKGAETPQTLRSLEIALRRVLADAHALDALEGSLEEA